MVIFLYNLYIFVWIQHGHLANPVSVLDPAKSVNKEDVIGYLSSDYREQGGKYFPVRFISLVDMFISLKMYICNLLTLSLRRQYFQP